MFDEGNYEVATTPFMKFGIMYCKDSQVQITKKLICSRFLCAKSESLKHFFIFYCIH